MKLLKRIGIQTLDSKFQTNKRKYSSCLKNKNMILKNVSLKLQIIIKNIHICIFLFFDER